MPDWTRLEVDLIVADYFSMLNDELVGKPYNKSQHRAALSPLLNNRTKGSIEFKHQNVSAALINLGMPYILGYKPLFNYQREMLEAAILEYLQLKKAEVEIKFMKFSDEVVTNKPALTDFANFLDTPPDKQDISEPKLPYGRRPFKINYLEREQMNASLGEKGEQLVIAFEKWNLNQAGKHNLADQIKWIAQDDDGAGFDILSRNLNGTDKFIEVKTTKLTKESPFYFSKSEYNFSKEKAANYHLYRVFQFATSPKMFQASGSFDDFCNKEAIQFKGFF